MDPDDSPMMQDDTEMMGMDDEGMMMTTMWNQSEGWSLMGLLI
jgi:hypothetical protein